MPAVIMAVTACALACGRTAKGQTASLRVTRPSPTAASLGKFGDVPVSLYTGVPDITVPIFNAKGKTLELPISLSYHAQGIRVEEIGGWVGIGWSLNAGGVITRTIRGLADEVPSGYYNTGNQLYSGSNWSSPSATFLDAIRNETVDGEPDQFFFNFAGRSGQFVMGPTSSTGPKEIRPIPYQKLKIESSGTVGPFVITTEDGTKYTFNAVETNSENNLLSTLEDPPHNAEVLPASWFLTEIRSAGGEVINLYYSPYTAQHRVGRYDESIHQRVGSCTVSDFWVRNEHEVQTQRLDSIKTAVHTIKFSAGTTLRTDALSPSGAPQEPRLDKITVLTPSGTVLRVFQLEHDYSTGRLTLAKVFEKDRNGNSLPPYVFTYEGTLPSTSSFSQDHWGFYNGKENFTLLPAIVTPSGAGLSGANRDPDAAAMRAGALTKITYPTGGYNEFVFEANTYGAIGPSETAPVVPGPPESASLDWSYPMSSQSRTFTVGGTSPVSATVYFTVDPSNCEPLADDGCPIASIVGKNSWTEPGTYLVSLQPGTYSMTIQESGLQGGSATMYVEWPGGPVSANKTGGGLRIAEVRAVDAMGNTTTRKYSYTLQSDPARSSGIIDAEPKYDFTYNSGTCSYYSRSSTSKMPLGAGTANEVAYREVTVLHGANGEFGKTRHVFRSIVNASDDAYAGVWPFSRRTSREWKRGQDVEATELDASGRAQLTMSSVYAFRDEGTAEPTTTRSFRGLSIHPFSAGKYGSAYFYNPFEVVSAWSYKETETTTTYDTLGTSSFASTRTYTYGNPNHVQLTELAETNSDGIQRITRMRYPADYATGSGNTEAAALTAMQGTANMHSPVIERWVIKRAGGVDSVMQAELNSFKQFASGQYLLYQRYVLNSPSGLTNFAPSAVSGGSFTKDTHYLLQETANAYDAAGRITQLTDGRGRITNYQYGGNINNSFLTQIVLVHDASGSRDLVTNFVYDGDGYIQSIQDEGGSSRTFSYDLFGRLRQIKNNAGTPIRAFGYQYSRTTPSFTYNAASPNALIDTSFLQQTPSQQSLVTTQYIDGLGRPIQTVTQNGASYIVAATQYDGIGRLWRSWKPYSRSMPGYDAAFMTNGTSFYNAYLGESQAKPYVETQYRPDALDRVSKVLPEYIGTAATTSTQHRYGVEAVAKLTIAESADETGRTARAYSDIFGNEAKTILGYGSAEATTTSFASDVLDQRIKVTDPRNLNTGYSLDTRGLLRVRTNPDAGSTTYKYDASGNIRYKQDANQASNGAVFFNTYDFANRLLVVGVGAATFSTLDPDATTPTALETTQGNWVMVQHYDAKPSTSAFPWSLFSAQIEPLILSNVAGRLAATASKSNGAWQVTLFSYDSDGLVATRYSYMQDNAGATVLVALNSVVTYVRDLRGELTQRLMSVGGDTFNHWYDYDGRGLLWKLFASNGSSKPAVADATYTYRPSGQLQDRQFQGGPLVPLKYTIQEQLVSIGDPASTAYPFSARYGYNTNGTLSTTEFYNAGSVATQKRYKYDFPAYDALNRFKSADFSSWSGSAWVSTSAYDLAGINYDPVGNLSALQRRRQDGTLIDNLTYTYQSTSNHLVSVSDGVGVTTEAWDAETGSFTYDANGNLVSMPGPYSIAAVAHDHRNLPISLQSNGVTTAYRYDNVGQRISKKVGSGNTEVYLVEGPATLGVLTVNAAGTLVSSYYNLLAGSKVVGRQTSGGTRRYYHPDLLGSTRTVVEGTTVVESYDFEPLGLPMPARTFGAGTKEGFTGKEQDAESGLDYFGARYYMPALGQWAEVDPMAAKHPEWSPYNYVLDNPLALVDPDGQQVHANSGGPVMATRTPFTRGPVRPGMFSGLAARGVAEIGNNAAPFVPLLSTIQDATAVVTGRDLTGSEVDAGGRVLAFVGLVTPLSGGELRLGEEAAEEGIKVGRTGGKLGDDAASHVVEPYNRRKHYGSTPTKADRNALGAGADEVVDHEPPLVKRYHEGDPTVGEKPGHQMTAAERRASAKDRSRMRRQSKKDSNKQGAEMSQYSREQNKKNRDKGTP